MLVSPTQRILKGNLTYILFNARCVPFLLFLFTIISINRHITQIQCPFQCWYSESFLILWNWREAIISWNYILQCPRINKLHESAVWTFGDPRFNLILTRCHSCFVLSLGLYKPQIIVSIYSFALRSIFFLPSLEARWRLLKWGEYKLWQTISFVYRNWKSPPGSGSRHRDHMNSK
jgi:hypothetical protein